MQLKVNQQVKTIKVDGDMPLLWVLRDELGMTGTKFGCGKGICGACTVLVGGTPTRCCVLPISAVGNREVRTIEGLSENDQLHAVQKAWVKSDVPQCGYCQPGQIMAAVSLLETKPKPTDADIDQAMTNICRCGTYNRIRAAIHEAADNIRGAQT